MAGKPQKMRGKYYTRIYKYLGNKKYKQILLPLGTSNKIEAESRLIIVRQYEAAIKCGAEVVLPWQNGARKAEIIHYNLMTATADYLRYKKAEQLSKSYISRICISLEHFMKVAGSKADVNTIAIEHIDRFKEYFSYNNRHTPNTINTNLDKINAFLWWLNDRNKIDKVPKIIKLRTGEALPKYVTDDEWTRIMNLDKVYRKLYGYYDSFDEHWKKAFYFYRETGCRLSEPFIGEINGNWLIVEIKINKTHKLRDIFIPDDLLPIFEEMRARVNQETGNMRDRIQSYSKKFRYACDALGIEKHFNCLRHTYALRRYLETGDIYLVSKELGHASVQTTEIYTKYDIRRLEQDFPSIKRVKELTEKSRNRVKSYTTHRIQIDARGANIVGQV